MNLPSVSVIIVTYRREEMLCRTLKSILSDNFKKKEIIVVDQTPQHEPTTKKFLETLADEGTIKLIFQETPNVSMARNRGIREAKNDICLFVDDDVEIKKNFIEAHAKNYTGPSITGVSGRVILAHPTNDDTGKFCHDPLKDWWYFKFDANEKIPVANALGCNMSFRKKALLESNGFDENFSENCWGEETDLCFQLKKKGGTIIFDPEAELVHYAAPKGGTRSGGRDVTLKPALYRNVTYFILKNLSHAERRRHFMLCYRCYVGREKDQILKKLSVFKKFIKRNLAFFKGLLEGIRLYRSL